MLDLGIKKLEKFSLPEEIVGERVVLVPRRHEFDEALFELIDSSRNFLREYLFWVDDTRSVDDVRKVTDIFQENWKKQDAFEFVFLDRESRRLVGAGGIHTISYLHHYAEYGYYLNQKEVGHGYITEAVRLLEKELFQRGIHRLIITCDVNNQASAAVARRCGFELEGKMREARFAYGSYRDELLFAKINPGNKMTNELEERLVAIEMALANQEKIMEDLNQVIIEQGRMIDRLVKQNQYLMTLAEQDTVKPLSEETPPPHY